MVQQNYDVNISKAVTIDCPRSEVFNYWRNFTHLPEIMSHLERVEPIDERRSHWVAKGPKGIRAEWNAEIISERVDEEIAWRSVEGSDVPNEGRVSFRDVPGKGTEVDVNIAFKHPGGALGETAATILGRSPERQIELDLEQFKRRMEQKPI